MRKRGTCSAFCVSSKAGTKRRSSFFAARCGITATDALWMGLPLLTCEGKSFPARVASSVLQALCMPELIAHSLDEYETKALQLATQPAMLAAVRHKLQSQRDTQPMFDTDRFRRHIEAAYRQMWDIFKRGTAPRSFTVSSD